MKFTQKSFSVNAPNTQEYRDNWERTFRPVKVCGALTHGLKCMVSCDKPAGHLEQHHAFDGTVWD